MLVPNMLLAACRETCVRPRRGVAWTMVLAGIWSFLAGSAWAQSGRFGTVRPERRIRRPVDNRRTVRLPGNRHALARPEFDAGAVPGEQRMERMILTLQPDAEQTAALEALLEAQHDPEAPEYQQWLTPESFAERFG